MARGRMLQRVVFYCELSSPRRGCTKSHRQVSHNSQQVAGIQLCPSCSRFAHDRGEPIGELGNVDMLSFDEMKRDDCLICSILCEGLEQYRGEQQSFPIDPGHLEFFTNAEMRFILI